MKAGIHPAYNEIKVTCACTGTSAAPSHTNAIDICKNAFFI